MRFDLIDRVLEHQADRIVAVKQVTSAEEYLADHFPGFAVLPGVMMLEALVQAARLLQAWPPRDGPYWPTDRPPPGGGSAGGGGISSGPLVLTQVRNVRYGQMVRPGQCLTVEVTRRGSGEGGSEGSEGRGWEFNGVGRVGDQTAVQGRFRLTAAAL